MSQSPKIAAAHLERQAYVYIRQSSPRQVQENLESQDLQYQLVQRAQGLGWDASQVVVIDDDLGKSAISAAQRIGFQELVAQVGLGHAGIILVTDVSRLARNCSDWYRLLDLASLCGTLISDVSGIYDPRTYDDRMLLGLKGAFSEAQWYQMRTQLCAAQLNKARRGELHLRLPVGLERQPDGTVILTPDQQIQQAIRLVFTQFERLGSVSKLLRFLRDQGVFLPRRQKQDIAWMRPSYQMLYHILKQPAYAGAYAYGKHHRTHLPGDTAKVVTHTLPIAQWPVLLQQAFPAYLSWQQFLDNQQRLAQNAQHASWTRSVPRNGAALLQGIVICGHCGRPMHIHYTHSPAYICDYQTRQFAAKRCQNCTLGYIDQAVTKLFLQAIQPARLEAALNALQQLAAQRQALATHWQQRLERAHYEAELARRRYARVDPDNRLVAAELERLWEEQLQALQQLESDWQRFQSEHLQPLALTDQQAIRSLAHDLPALWHAASTTHEQRKRLLRCLIQQVTLDSHTQPGFTLIHVLWHTGFSSTLCLPRPRHGSPPASHVADRIRCLAHHLPDHQIAVTLNAQIFPTATGLPWTWERVRAVRRKHRIPTACPDGIPSSSPRGDGLIKSSEAARRLGVNLSMISTWFRQGFLSGSQRQPHAPLWVRLDAHDLDRLHTPTPSPGMIPYAQAPLLLNLSKEQICDTIRAGMLVPYRVRSGDYWKWFLLPVESPPL
jgi:DNA invertase Pin-like site-specific DNA recombinase